MYFVYVLKSEVDNKFYYGYTDNLDRRLDYHNNGLVKSTRSRRPLRLVYYEEVDNLSLALSKEKYFKSGFGRKFLKKKIGPIV